MFEALLIAGLFAVLFAAVASGGLGWRRSAGTGLGASFFLLFLLLLIPTWIGGMWLVPFGPYYYGTAPVLPYFFVGLAAITLVLVAAPWSDGGFDRRGPVER